MIDIVGFSLFFLLLAFDLPNQYFFSLSPFQTSFGLIGYYFSIRGYSLCCLFSYTSSYYILGLLSVLQYVY